MRPAICTTFLLLALASPLTAQPIFNCISDETTISYDSFGDGTGSMSFYFREDPTSGFPHNVQGWALSVGHDPAWVEALGVEQGEYIASLNGGAGPDFWQVEPMAEGFTIGTVYGFLGGTVCTYEVQKEIAIVEYKTIASALVGDSDGATVDLEFAALGTPPVTTVVVISSVNMPVICALNPLQLVPASEGFIRGDCNLDQVVNLADPIYLGTALFAGGGPIGCVDACDANDDGTVDVADVVYTPNHLFGGGPPPPSPYPACGSDLTDDLLNCATPCP